MKKLITFILATILIIQAVPSIAANPKEITIEGTIEVIDIVNRQITILDWDDNLHTIDLPKEIKVTDLYFGQEVIATVRDRNTVKIQLIEEDDPTRDGYIIPNTRFRVGTVLFATNQDIEILTTKSREKYKIDPFSTTLYKKGMVAELRQLKEGDRVLLTFNDPYSSTVSEIKIEDEEKHIEGVLKGKIEMVDERNKEVIISQPKVLNQGVWTGTVQKTQIKLGTGSIYEGGKKLTLSDLQKRKGLEAYVAYENAFGKQSVGKMLIKAGSSMEYNDLLQNIDYGNGQMIVDSNMFFFHDGTIVVKDNRLVDSLNLNKYQDIYLVSDFKNGMKQASVVSIEGTTLLEDRIDGSRLLVYKGKIEDVLDYKLILGNNFKLDKTILTTAGFVSNPSSEEMIFTEDTLVYDSELKKNIPTKSFLDSKYIDLIDIKDKSLRDRIQKDYYKNKPAYVVARETELGKEVLSINLVPQETNSYNQLVRMDYSTLGEIKNIDQGTKTIELTKVTNYNTLTKRWEKGTDETLDLTQAIVLVNDKPIPLEEIYKIRKTSKAYLVKQKQTSRSTTYIILIED